MTIKNCGEKHCQGLQWDWPDDERNKEAVYGFLKKDTSESLVMIKYGWLLTIDNRMLT